MGIDIVEDEDVEEELAATEEDREVENLLWSNCQKHDRLQKGTVYSFGVVSVERYDSYVQYSRSVKCRECRKIQVLCTVQYMG